MTGTFADSFYFLALLSPRDAAHARAHAVTGTLRGRIVTTTFVLLELADALCHHGSRQAAVEFIRAIQVDPDFEIIPASTALFNAAFDLYARRPDKDWSLTDCTSFVVMRQHGLTDALTADHHFQQACFNPLLLT